MRFGSLSEWLVWQERLHPRAVDLGLQRVRAVAQRLGVLQPTCPVITVGGTNGKGSCVALIEALLTAGGYRVGAFTSPHLFRYNERIRIKGRLATDTELMRAFERIDSARADISLTFFEFNTLAALCLFQTPLDAIVLEVGLGGRLDAVNIVDADVALVASVGIDHADWLGETLEEIGREKAGIFRSGRPAVFGGECLPRSVEQSARDVGAKLRVAGGDFQCEVRLDRWDWRYGEAEHLNLPLPALVGLHQPRNAAAVLTALYEIRDALPLSREHIEHGLRSVSLRARFEVVGSAPQWILDVAHNADAASVFAAELGRRPVKGRTIGIVGILGDKDVPAVVGPLLPHVDVWIATGLNGPRAISAQELRARLAPGSSNWLTAESVQAACEQARQLANPEDRIVVFGSFHTVGPALQWLEAARLAT